ncbi:MAG: PCRF domain-containing protein, partial [Cyanobacteria bacterium P01_C01_bin.38]
MHQISARIRDLEKRLVKPEFWQDNVIAQNSLQELNYLIFCEQEQYREWLTRLNDIKAALELLESETDEQLEQELIANYNFLSNELKHVEILNLLNQPFDDKGTFITITAGNNDLDSQDWVNMLVRMYSRCCDNRYYKIRLVDESLGEWGGFNYALLEIFGEYAYGNLKSEQGIHQLRRISPFSKDSQIQTSFAKVEVIPIVDESMDFEIPEKDLEIYLPFASANSHRQRVLVNLTHIPTGISFTSKNERNQLQNKEQALTVVKSKLFALMQTQGVALKDIKKPSSKNVVNNPIREYIFHPYQQVKDLRTNVETNQIEEVMEGNLDLFIRAYLKLGIA